MTISCPTPQWPTGLLAIGPAPDRTILLRGSADIAGAPYTVYAIRVDPISMGADLRADLPANAYAESEVRGLMDRLADLTELTDRSLVRLQHGAYALLMLPESAD